MPDTVLGVKSTTASRTARSLSAHSASSMEKTDHLKLKYVMSWQDSRWKCVDFDRVVGEGFSEKVIFELCSSMV